MLLKELTDKQRILFLKLFTLELINTLSREEHIKNKIKIEKLRQEFIEPKIAPEKAIENLIKSPVFQPSRYPIEEHPEQFQHEDFRKNVPKTLNYSRQFRFIKKPLIENRNKTTIEQYPLPKPLYQSMQIKKEILQHIQPQYQQIPRGFNIGKIEIFFRDPYVQSIECPGPGKNILVKKYNHITPARESLTQEEINQIINLFSQEARIPIVGGILKAAVGNLVISAVISEFVGSRFIITRIYPS